MQACHSQLTKIVDFQICIAQKYFSGFYNKLRAACYIKLRKTLLFILSSVSNEPNSLSTVKIAIYCVETVYKLN